MSNIDIISEYLGNFFAEADHEQLTQIVEELDDAIVMVLSTLIDTDSRYRSVINKVTNKIANLEKQIQLRDQTISELKENLQHLGMNMPSTINQPIEIKYDETRYTNLLQRIHAATSNPLLSSIAVAINDYWNSYQQPIDLLQIHQEFGQKRIISSFNDAYLHRNQARKAGRLLNQLFIQGKVSGRRIIHPTELGNKVLNLHHQYYVHQTISQRFNNQMKNGMINSTRQKLLIQIASNPNSYSNSLNDRQKLAASCNIHPDNVMKHIIKLVEIGFVQRVPDTYSNKKYSLTSFDNQYILSMLKQMITE